MRTDQVVSKLSRPRVAAATVLGATVLGATVLAGCGSTTTSGTPTASTTSRPSGVLSAYQATTGAGTARLALDISASGGAAPSGGVSFSANGAANFAAHSTELSLNLPGAGPVNLVVVGQTLYIELPPEARGSLGGKPWAAVDVAALAQASGSSLSGIGASDPTQVLGLVQSISPGGVTDLGTATVRGQTTTHYRATLDLSKLATAAGEQGSPYANALSQLHLSSLPVDLYIDGQGRLARLVIDVNVPASAVAGAGASSSLPGASGNLEVKITLDLFDFGSPVSISAPAPDQVAQLSASELGALGGGSTAGATSPVDTAMP